MVLQAVQEPDWRTANVLKTHVSQALGPEYLPAGHTSHCEGLLAPVKVDIVPGEHAVQSPMPVVLAYRPLGQSVHTVDTVPPADA